MHFYTNLLTMLFFVNRSVSILNFTLLTIVYNLKIIENVDKLNC